MPSDDSKKLTDAEFELLRNLINKKSGIFLNKSRKHFLERRLSKRLVANNLNRFREYYLYLKYDSNNSSEWNAVYNLITVKETSFFRYKEQFNVFGNHILPKILEEKKKQNNKTIKIWSAGCSTGEEPYTIAMIIFNSLGRRLANWDIKILASDISSQAIEFAKRGLYGRYTLRNTPEDYKTKFFDKIEEDFSISDSIKDMVQFKTFNLVDESQIRKTGNIDVIFCRNTLIYFDNDTRKNFTAQLYDCLNPNGYLFLGHSESLYNITKSFKVLQFPKAIVYVKE